jgi:hypothetical protein
LYFATVECPSARPENHSGSAKRLTKNDAISRAGTPAPLAFFYRRRRKLGWMTGALRRRDEFSLPEITAFGIVFIHCAALPVSRGATMLRPRPVSPVLAAALHAKERDRRP